MNAHSTRTRAGERWKRPNQDQPTCTQSQKRRSPRANNTNFENLQAKGSTAERETGTAASPKTHEQHRHREEKGQEKRQDETRVKKNDGTSRKDEAQGTNKHPQKAGKEDPRGQGKKPEDGTNNQYHNKAKVEMADARTAEEREGKG